MPFTAGVCGVLKHSTMMEYNEGKEPGESERRCRMSELRTPEVEDLLTVFSKIQDKDDIFLLLEDLFTIREIRETSQRLAVARQLDAGNSYASIEKATGASATTIARVSKCLSYGAGGYTMALNILDDARKGK